MAAFTTAQEAAAALLQACRADPRLRERVEPHIVHYIARAKEIKEIKETGGRAAAPHPQQPPQPNLRPLAPAAQPAAAISPGSPPARGFEVGPPPLVGFRAAQPRAHFRLFVSIRSVSNGLVSILINPFHASINVGSSDFFPLRWTRQLFRTSWTWALPRSKLSTP